MPGSWRSQRQRTVSELRAQGRYGPELRDVVPGFVGLGLGLGQCLRPCRCLRGFTVRSASGLVLGVVLLTIAGTTGWRLRRVVVRRCGGRYTAVELARLDDRGLAVAATRMLRRDGWRVLDLSKQEGRPRLSAQDRGGRELDVVFRPVVAVDEDEGANGPAPLRDAGRPGSTA